MLDNVYICLCQSVLGLGVFSLFSYFLSRITNLCYIVSLGQLATIPSMCCFAFLSFFNTLCIFITHFLLLSFRLSHWLWSNHNYRIAKLFSYCGPNLTMLAVWGFGDSIAQSGATREVLDMHSLQRRSQSQSNTIQFIRRQREITCMSYDQNWTGLISASVVVV